MNEAPVLVAAQRGTVAENQSPKAIVMTIKMRDPDSTMNDNRFELLDGAAPFGIDTATGLLMTTRSLDFEKDATTYQLSVRVCDAQVAALCSVGSVTVDVNDVAEAPTFPSGVVCSVVENTAVLSGDVDRSVCAFAALDPDAGSCLSYSISDKAQTLFELVTRTSEDTQQPLLSNQCTNSSVELRVKPSVAASQFDFEAQAMYSVALRVVDATGLAASGVVTVNIVNANDCPTLQNMTFMLRERAPRGTLIGYPLPARDQDVGDQLRYEIQSSDAPVGLLAIDAMSGQLQVARDPREDASELVFPAVYRVQVKVTDGGTTLSSASPCSVTAVVEIQTTNANFAPVWSPKMPSVSVNENVPNGTLVGPALAAFVTEPDKDVITLTLQSKADTLCADTFALHPRTGQLTLRAGRSLNYETQRTYTCTVVACDPFDMCAVRDLSVQVQDLNEAPQFPVDVTDFEFDENTVNIASRCLSALDPDAGDGPALTYALSCVKTTRSAAAATAECAPFDVRVEKDYAMNACARLVLKTPLNYEDKATYRLVLVATDRSGLAGSQNVTIRVRDVNEPQTFVALPSLVSVDENVASGTQLWTTSVIDPDTSSPVFSEMRFVLTGVVPVATDLLAIDPISGVVSVVGALDFESVQSYVVTIEARDVSATPIVKTADVRVVVRDVADTTIDTIALRNGSTLSTSGGETIELSGSNLGFAAVGDWSLVSLSVQYGPYGASFPFTALNCAIFDGNRGVRCLSAPGIGTNLFWRVALVVSTPTLGTKSFGAVSTVPLGSYTAPTLLSVGCIEPFPTDGRRANQPRDIVVNGTNFGHASIAAYVSQMITLDYGGHEARDCVLLSTAGDVQSIACRSNVGTGAGFSFTVIVAEQQSNAVDTIETSDPAALRCRYAPPAISRVRLASANAQVLRTVGGDRIVINGTNFGTQGAAPLTVRYQSDLHLFELDDCVVTLDHVGVECESLPGAGAGLSWTVEVDGQRSDVFKDATNSIVAYAAPTIAQIVGFSELPTAGGSLYRVEGFNFAPDSALYTDPIVEYSRDDGVTLYRSENCKRKYSNPSFHSQLECVAVAGTGRGFAWRVLVQGQHSPWFLQSNTSYAGPIVTRVLRPTGEAVIRTDGAEQIVIYGKNFGERNVSRITSVTYGVQGDELLARDCAVVVDHEQISCRTAPGVGARLSWIVKIDGQASAMPTISYARPFIASIDGPGAIDAAVEGGQLVYLRGGNFGPSSIAIERVTYGPSGREFIVSDIVRHDDAVIVCRTVAGVGTQLSWIVLVGGQESTASAATTSYAAPQIRSIVPLDASTDGTTLVTVTGVNLAAKHPFAATRVLFTPPQRGLPSVRLPISSFGDVANSTLEFVIVRIPVGLGAGATLQLLVGTASVQRTDAVALSYREPVIDRVFVDEGPSACLPSCISLTISGSNLFTSGRVFVSRLPLSSRPSSAELAAATIASVSAWTHDTVVVPEYSGRLGFATVWSGSAVWSNSVAFSWDDPVVLDWNTLSASCAVADCTTSHRLDGNPALYRTVETELANVYRQDAATVGGARLSLYVKYVGRSPQVRVGDGDGALCTDVQLRTPVFDPLFLLSVGVSDVSEIRLLTCTLPSGQGRLQRVVVGRGNAKSSPRFLNYIAPTVDWTAASAATAPTLGKSVTLQGSNLGTAPTVTLRRPPSSAYGAKSVAVTVVQRSHTSIQFAIPAGEGGGWTLVLSVGNQEVSTPFSYEIPVVLTMTASSTRTSGGGELRLSGRNFGSLSLSTAHRVWLASANSSVDTTAASCAITALTHTSLTCVLSEGQGAQLRVLVDVSGQRSAGDVLFSFSPPVIHTVSRLDGPTSGYTCACFQDPERPCATLTAPVSCRFLESATAVSSANVNAKFYCVTSMFKGKRRAVTMRVVSDVFSNGKAVYQSVNDDGSAVVSDTDIADLVLARRSGVWQLVQRDVVLFAASVTTDTPPPTTWSDVTVSPPVAAVAMTVYPGSCKKMDARVCPADTERCERVAVTITGDNFGVKTGDWTLELQPAKDPDDYLLSSPVMEPLEPVVVTVNDVVFFSHTTIQFYLPPGEGAARRLFLAVASQPVVNASIAFAYEQPQLLAIETSTSNRSTCGGYEIALYGKSLGATHAVVLVGGRDARVDGRSSHLNACGADRCLYGSSGPCIDVQHAVCYPSQSAIDSDGVLSFSTTCDVAGVELALCSPQTNATELALMRSESLLHHDHFVIRTLVPPGFGANLDIVVVVGGRASNALPFTYNQPLILAQMPNQPDANGLTAIEIRGSDFGCFPNQGIEIGFAADDAYTRRQRLLTDADTNTTAAANGSSVEWKAPGVLVWQPPKTRAGVSKIQLSLGGNRMSPESQTELRFQCSSGFFKTAASFCEECPVGATCRGGDAEPEAKPGYWREHGVVLACDPFFACLGANECAVGYTDERCSRCSDGYHKLNGECNLCPSQPWTNVAVVFCLILFGAVISYLLIRKGVSLGLLSIGIDYFQTLSIFGNARIAWPQGILSVFSTLSAFNLNLELIAPECFNVQVSYKNKWAVIEALPLVLTTISLLLFATRYAYKRFVLRRTTRLTSHKPQLFGSTLVMMYYLFLYLTRTTLEVFNCVESIPPDGHRYMVALHTKCFTRGGVHLALFPWAVLSFIVYSMGYPLFVFRTLAKNKALVQEDQLLRAMRRGTSRRTNPNCWEFRKKFAKLYYQFKPRFWYWMVVIIARKFLIACIGLLFRQYPTFQLACVMLVLFINYAFQVRNRPYMSAYETQHVLDEYMRHVAHETRLAKLRGETYHPPPHLRLLPDATAATVIGGTTSGSSGGGGSGAGGSGTAGATAGGGAVAATRLAQQQTMVEYLWDHNTVEATLLFSACLVLLSGIMFESGQLGNVQEGFHSAGAQFLSFWTMLLIFASCLYFAIVLVTELLVALRPDYFARIHKVQKVFSQHSRHRDDAAGDDSDGDDALEMVAHRTANPLFQKQAEASAQALLEKTRQQDAILALQEMKLRGLERKHTRRGSYVLALQPNEARRASVAIRRESQPTPNESDAREYFSDPEQERRRETTAAMAEPPSIDELIAAGDEVELSSSSSPPPTPSTMSTTRSTASSRRGTMLPPPAAPPALGATRSSRRTSIARATTTTSPPVSPSSNVPAPSSRELLRRKRQPMAPPPVPPPRSSNSDSSRSSSSSSSHPSASSGSRLSSSTNTPT
ncbi:hypothetical protein PINS_up010828 [Pythium insidiosum]|nr:hypothetical protein PINS_up010828 [Pythium insidiosum]